MKIEFSSRLPVAMIALLCVGSVENAFAQIDNTQFGTGALAANTGDYNSAFGYDALHLNTSGGGNTAVGRQALNVNTTGGANSAFGDVALNSNTTGSENTAVGQLALTGNRTGSNNTAVGEGSLEDNTSGSWNTATGEYSLPLNTTGSYNTASGFFALNGNRSGRYNIGIGYQAGYYAATGNNNIEIGNFGVAADNNVIRMGTQGTQTFTAIAGISGVNVKNGVAVLVNSKGQLGVMLSSIRYKENVEPMGEVSDRLLKLRPVTFRYKQPDEDGNKPEQYGLIAEEVAKVMPELVVYNDNGQPETIAYRDTDSLAAERTAAGASEG